MARVHFVMLFCYEITIEQPSLGQKVGQCSNDEVTKALVRQNDVTKSSVVVAIRHFRYDIPAIRPL